MNGSHLNYFEFLCKIDKGEKIYVRSIFLNIFVFHSLIFGCGAKLTNKYNKRTYSEISLGIDRPHSVFFVLTIIVYCLFFSSDFFIILGFLFTLIDFVFLLSWEP